ncbi:hypothetical protein TNCV_4743201 [Trichonephila clavipes]|nr:hypothetical protein TNCV_4743201 [Trichonephila clavipes]
MRYTVTPSIDSWHHDSLVLCPLHPETPCVATHAMAPRGNFQQNNARPHTAKVSQDCFRTFNTLPWHARSPDLFQSSISGIIWDGDLGISRV